MIIHQEYGSHMHQIQSEPASLRELQESYDTLYQGWMRDHKNLDQTNRMLDLLQVERGMTLADIGCGTGYVLDIAARRGLVAYGVDISVVALQQAKEQNQCSPQVLLAKGEELPWPAQAFDFVMILGSLEHFLDPAQAVREAARILKPNGKAAILVPNSHHIRAIYNVIKYGEILSDLQKYERFATRREWEHLLAENGLQVRSVHKFDTGMARVYRKGREIFWTVYNVLFRLFDDRWIPLNLTYSFIFICEPENSSGFSGNSCDA